MKAIVYHRYGWPDVLRFEEIEKPTAGDNEVLIKVRAASVNPYDWHFMRGTPYLVRLMAGLRQPKATRLGADVAGQVEAVGRNVTQFKRGDDVFGTCVGAFSEYVCVSESALAMKPDTVTFERTFACRSPSRSARWSPAYAVQGIWRWCDPSAQIMSLTTPKRISPNGGRITI
jgi:NADPH:quinone reductase-like Zn-dependent oxidoreductase